MPNEPITDENIDDIIHKFEQKIEKDVKLEPRHREYKDSFEPEVRRFFEGIDRETIIVNNSNIAIQKCFLALNITTLENNFELTIPGPFKGSNFLYCEHFNLLKKSS